jgi:hypothetical protein
MAKLWGLYIYEPWNLLAKCLRHRLSIFHLTVLWPQIGDLCTVVMECVMLQTILLHSDRGIWIVDVALEWSAFVGCSWDVTMPRISEFALWTRVHRVVPTEDNIERQTAMEVLVFRQEYLTAKESRYESVESCLAIIRKGYGIRL